MAIRLKNTLFILLFVFSFVFLSHSHAQTDNMELAFQEVDEFLNKFDFNQEFNTPVCYSAFLQECLNSASCQSDTFSYQAEKVTDKNDSEHAKISIQSQKGTRRENQVTAENWDNRNGNALRFWAETQWQQGLQLHPYGVGKIESQVLVDGENKTVTAMSVRLASVYFNRIVAEHEFIVTKDLPGFAQVISHNAKAVGSLQTASYELQSFDSKACE